MKLKILILVIFLFSIVSCENKNVSRIIRDKIEIDGKQREYILYLPKDLPDNSPLVFVIHGFTDNAENMMKTTGFNALADVNKFAVCYPQGLTDNDGRTFWEVGYKFTQSVHVNDVIFFVELTADLQQKYKLNKEKTFATGMSNGAGMCIMLTCKASEVFKAVAPVCGTIMKTVYDESQNLQPIPVFMINSTADKITSWNGDLENTQGWGVYLSTPDLLKFFVERNKCTQFETDTLPDINTADSSFVITEKHTHGVDRNEVWFYKVVNGGHDWPGWSGNMDINASREVWNFFKNY